MKFGLLAALATIVFSTTAQADYLPDPRDLVWHIDRTDSKSRQKIASIRLCIMAEGIKPDVMEGYTGTDIVIKDGKKLPATQKKEIDDCIK